MATSAQQQDACAALSPTQHAMAAADQPRTAYGDLMDHDHEPPLHPAVKADPARDGGAPPGAQGSTSSTSSAGSMAAHRDLDSSAANSSNVHVVTSFSLQPRTVHTGGRNRVLPSTTQPLAHLHHHHGEDGDERHEVGGANPTANHSHHHPSAEAGGPGADADAHPPASPRTSSARTRKRKRVASAAGNPDPSLTSPASTAPDDAVTPTTSTSRSRITTPAATTIVLGSASSSPTPEAEDNDWAQRSGAGTPSAASSTGSAHMALARAGAAAAAAAAVAAAAAASDKAGNAPSRRGGRGAASATGVVLPPAAVDDATRGYPVIVVARAARLRSRFHAHAARAAAPMRRDLHAAFANKVDAKRAKIAHVMEQHMQLKHAQRKAAIAAAIMASGGGGQHQGPAGAMPVGEDADDDSMSAAGRRGKRASARGKGRGAMVAAAAQATGGRKAAKGSAKGGKAAAAAPPPAANEAHEMVISDSEDIANDNEGPGSPASHASASSAVTAAALLLGNSQGAGGLTQTPAGKRLSARQRVPTPTAAAASAAAAATAAGAAAAGKGGRWSRRKAASPAPYAEQDVEMGDSDFDDMGSVAGGTGSLAAAADDNESDAGSLAPQAVGGTGPAPAPALTPAQTAAKSAKAAARAAREFETQRARAWRSIAATHVPRAARSVQANLAIRVNNYKRLAKLLEREALVLRRGQGALAVGPLGALATQLSTSRSAAAVELSARAKRVVRESLLFWKHNEKLEKEAQKRAHAAALERQRQIDEMRELKRQERKLNFLLSQTELFTHFVSKKLAPTASSATSPTAAAAMAVTSPTSATTPLPAPANADASPNAAPEIDAETGEAIVKAVDDINFDDDAECVAQARAYAADAAKKHATNVQQFTVNVQQPKMLACELKEYQLKGLEWLISLYEQGINGILADEMGLGKTVQSIALLAWLAENNDMWGPYLVVTPASTLHNWQQELAKFVPAMKVIPYWGTPQDRQVLRQFWARKKQVYTRDSPAHVVVTSYQYAITDLKHLMSVEWEYMILDEAQAIKSSSSMRWNALLQVKSRNRLLLTGTPVQNSMKELWALLHFIMPTLFDNHHEFNEWFSRDIESAAVNKRQMNAEQVKRLHMILQPFMLRRVKRDVQSELGDKIEVKVSCVLSKKQQLLYRMLKQKLSIRDILESVRNGGSGSAMANAMRPGRRRKQVARKPAVAGGDDDELARDLDPDEDDGEAGNTLMNVVMQLRKVCNHPDLMERAETASPFVMMPRPLAAQLPIGNSGDEILVLPRARSAIEALYPRRLTGLVRDVGAMSAQDRRTSGMTSFIARFNLNVPQILCGYSPEDITRVRRMNVLERAEFDADIRRRPHACWRAEEPTRRVSPDGDRDPVARRVVRDSSLLQLEDGWHPTSLQFVQPAAVAAPPVDWRYVQGAPAATVSVACYPRFDSDDDDDGENAADIFPHVDPEGVLPRVPTSSRILPLLPTMPSAIQVPNMQSLVSSSGKLLALEHLLPKLKSEGHRCLIYFQMTRMMDLMEDYLTYRKYSYLRLDGSTTLGDRRDLVSDWQTRDDLFLFLLSTRAGGVGINLTAADTVIFFDSDWNPTVDRQAMDRAHRLGQTRQVTVYRLCTRHSIEERILERARTKDHIQRVVISGAPGADETGAEPGMQPSATEMVSLLFGDDDDDEAMRAMLEEEMKREEQASKTGGAKGGRGGRKKRPGTPSSGQGEASTGGGGAGTTPATADAQDASKAKPKRGRKTKPGEQPQPVTGNGDAAEPASVPNKEGEGAPRMPTPLRKVRGRGASSGPRKRGASRLSVENGGGNGAESATPEPGAAATSVGEPATKKRAVAAADGKQETSSPSPSSPKPLPAQANAPAVQPADDQHVDTLEGASRE